MSSNVTRRLHAIQLTTVDVRKLSIEINGDDEDIAEFLKKGFQLASAHGDYDTDDHCIQVGLRFVIGAGEKKPPLSMHIELIGNFTVDEKDFLIEDISDWAIRNAPLVLYPFIREHAYSLTTRCGLPPAILPLLQVPTLETKKFPKKVTKRAAKKTPKKVTPKTIKQK